MPASTVTASKYVLVLFLFLFVGCGPLDPQFADAGACAARPALQWNTFLGGAGTDYGNSIAAAGASAVLVCGMSMEGWGTPVRPFGVGNWDAVVAKLDTGGALLWHTFLGQESAASDSCSSVRPTSTGEVVVGGGSTESWELPRRAFASGRDAFVAKLDGDGRLLWNTFLGGAGDDEAWEVAVGDNGDVYVVGSSSAAWGTPGLPFGGQGDGWVVKLDANGNLLWHIFLGGGGSDVALSLELAGDGSLLVSGYSSASWGTPVGSFSGGATDAFVARLSPGGDLLWNTFVGGGRSDEGRALSLAADGGAFLVGPSENGPAGGQDAFIARLESDGALRWSRFLGGSAVDVGDGVVPDGRGGIYVSGFSRGAWGEPDRPYQGGLSDAFAARVDGEGRLLWSTFLGSPGGPGPDDDYGNALTVGAGGRIYVVGDSDARWGEPGREFVTGSHDLFVAGLEEPRSCSEPPRSLAVGCDCGSGSEGLASGVLLLFGCRRRKR